jgi:hypothetical protein
MKSYYSSGLSLPFSFPGRPTRAPRRPQPLRRPRPLTGRSHLSVPRLSLPLPLPDGPRSSAAPSPRTVAATHPSVSPPPPLFGRQRVHDSRRARPPVSGRCRSGAARRPAGTPPTRATSSTRRPRRSTPLRFLPLSAPFKKGTLPLPAKIRPHAAIFSPPLRLRAATTSFASAASRRAAPPLTGARSSPLSVAASCPAPPRDPTGARW